MGVGEVSGGTEEARSCGSSDAILEAKTISLPSLLFPEGPCEQGQTCCGAEVTGTRLVANLGALL